MNKYLKQLIEKYEQKSLWDIRARNGQKAMLMPVNEWLDAFNHPMDNECFAAYRTPRNIHSSHKIQGLMTHDKKYFLYEGTPRYENVPNFKEPVTFIFIKELDNLYDSMGYAEDYLYIRSRVPEVNKGTFSVSHAYIAYSILTTYANFNDIGGYTDFLNRYTGENGDILCRSKKVNQALNLALNKILKTESDFKQLEWTTYSEDEEKAPLFYVDTTKSYTNKFTRIYIDGGIYE